MKKTHIQEYKTLIKLYPNWEKYLEDRDIELLKLYLNDYSYKQISIKLNLTYSQIHFKIFGDKSPYGNIYNKIQKTEENERSNIKKEYTALIKVYPNWEKCLVDEDIELLKLYLNGYNFNQISKILDFTIGQINNRIFGKGETRKSSIYNKILTKNKISHKELLEKYKNLIKQYPNWGTQLNKEDTQLLKLYLMGNYSYEDISKIMNIPITIVFEKIMGTDNGKKSNIYNQILLSKISENRPIDLLRIKKMSLKEKYKKAIEKCPNWEKKLKEEEVCIVKLYLDDCSYNEISNKTNMTNNQIKYKLSGLKRNNKGSLCDKILRKRKGTKHKKVIEDNLQPK